MILHVGNVFVYFRTDPSLRFSQGILHVIQSPVITQDRGLRNEFLRAAEIGET